MTPPAGSVPILLWKDFDLSGYGLKLGLTARGFGKHLPALKAFHLCCGMVEDDLLILAVETLNS